MAGARRGMERGRGDEARRRRRRSFVRGFDGVLTMTEILCDGRWPAGDNGLALRELRGRGRLAGDIRLGPLRFRIGFSFTIQRKGDLLLLRPRRGRRFLAVLGSWLGWRTADDGSFLLDPAGLSGGWVALSGGDTERDR